MLGDREGGIKVTKARGLESGAWRMRMSLWRGRQTGLGCSCKVHMGDETQSIRREGGSKPGGMSRDSAGEGLAAQWLFFFYFIEL